MTKAKCSQCEGKGEIVGLFPVWAEDVAEKDRKPAVVLPCPYCSWPVEKCNGK